MLQELKDNLINMPQRLDLNFMNIDANYELIAMVNFIGTSCKSGH